MKLYINQTIFSTALGYFRSAFVQEEKSKKYMALKYKDLKPYI